MEGGQKQQTIFIYLNFPMHALEKEARLEAVFQLQDILTEVIEVTQVGKFDGNEFCKGPAEESVTFFIYGDSADTIYSTIEPILNRLPNLPGSYLIKRYGQDEKAREEMIVLA